MQIDAKKILAEIDSQASAVRTPAQIMHDLSNGKYFQGEAGPDYQLAVRTIHRAANERLSLIIHGGVGTGKTLLAKAAFPKYAFVHANAIEDTVPSGDVILDDIGAEPSRNNFGVKQEPFADWIVKWYMMSPAERCRLCITTNLTAAQIEQRYGERVTSRLNATTVKLQLTGRDRRGNGVETQPKTNTSEDPAINAIVKDFKNLIRNWKWWGINFGLIMMKSIEHLPPAKARYCAIMMYDIYKQNKQDNQYPDAGITPKEDQSDENRRGWEMIEQWIGKGTEI